MRRLTILSLILLLSACGAPAISTPLPTPQAIGVTYPLALQPWADKLSICASGNSQVALYFNPSNNPGTSIPSNDILLVLGQPVINESQGYSSQVGMEQIVVIVNKENPLEQLSMDEIGSIFSGQLSTWPEGSGQPIQVWVLPEGDPARKPFDQTFLQTRALTTQALLAPDPAAMLEAVSTDVDSIGYLPKSYLNASSSVNPGNVHFIQLDKSAENGLNQPVIALTRGEPAGLLRSLLVCVQTDTP
jgi:hypothetical protein